MKRIYLIAGMIMCMFAMTACGDNNSKDKADKEDKAVASKEAENKKTEYDVAGIAQSIVENVSFASDDMTSIVKEMADNAFGITELNIEEEAVYMGAGTTDLVAVFKAPEGKMEDLKKAMEAYIEEQTKLVESYTPEQVDSLKNCLTVEKGNYYFVIVSNDNDKVKTIIDEQ